jgi:hypothetical protein
MFHSIFYINVNDTKLGTAPGNLLSGKRGEEERERKS